MNFYSRWFTPEFKGHLPLWLGEGSISYDLSRDRDTRSLLAFDDSHQVVAISEWFTSKVHQTKYFLDIRVNSELRRQGIGTEVYRLASQLRNRELDFMHRDYLHTVWNLFSHSLGASTIQTVPPDHANVANRFVLRPMPEIHSLQPEDTYHFEQAYLSMYEWTHEEWLPVSGEHHRTIRRTSLSNLSFDLTSIHRDGNGEINAFTAVYFDNNKAMIIGEPAHPSTPNGERIIEGYLRRTLDELHKAGIWEVTMDGHISDSHFFPQWIKLSPYGEWFQLLEIPASTQPTTIAKPSTRI